MLKKIMLAGILSFAAMPAHADMTIGLVGPLTGKYAVFGEQMKRGASQAVDDINMHGGIDGDKIVLKIVDDACDPKQAVAAANQLASSGIKFVVGHYCSGSAIPASKVYMDEGVFFITPASTNPKLTDEAKDLIFRVCGRDDRQGAVIGSYILNHFRGQKVAIAQDMSAYGRGLADEVKHVLNAGGVTEALFESYTPGERDYAALVSKIKQSGANLLFLGGYHTEAGLIARQLKEQSMNIQIIGGDALMTDELWSIAGPAAEGLMMTFGPDPRHRPEAKQAIDALRRRAFEPEGYTLYTYAAVQIVAEGIRRAGKDDALKAAMALRKAPVNTVIGPIGFDAKGDVVQPSYVLYKWHSGKYAEAGD